MPISPLRRVAVVGAALAGLALSPPAVALGHGCEGQDAMPSAANVAAIRHTTLCLLNGVRRAHHRHGLRSNPALELAAQKYSDEMVADRFFDHVAPNGTTFIQRIQQTPYLSSAASWSLGENLAWGSGFYATPKQTVSAWMHSAGHRHNILEPRYREIGIGVSPGTPVDDGGVPGATYTTEFGKRVH